MQNKLSYTNNLKNKIIKAIPNMWNNKKHFINMLDYMLDLFNSHGLGSEYYGYHNTEHELDVTYITMLIGNHKLTKINNLDLKYLYVSALFHDFDPLKSIDKPHENNVIKFLALDKNFKKMLKLSKLDFNIIKSLILRTTYPWKGKLKQNAEKKIKNLLTLSNLNKKQQEHIMELGNYLSIIDRISGYTIGNFNTAMNLAKKNAHSLSLPPSLIIKNSVSYFEDLFNEELDMCKYILNALPKSMKKNFMNNVFSFMNLRQHEIQIKANYIHENIKFIPKVETKIKNKYFIKILLSIYTELPKPLQLDNNFNKSIRNSNIILITLRIGNKNGQVIGFAKGAPLEKYKFRQKINDKNFGIENTVFLEPIALKSGYWGLHGGSDMRYLFIHEARKKFKFLTSFALRNVIKNRIIKNSNIEFVTKFNPEHWDYYRIKL